MAPARSVDMAKENSRGWPADPRCLNVGTFSENPSTTNNSRHGEPFDQANRHENKKYVLIKGHGQMITTMVNGNA